MSDFSPERFASWLNTSFRESNFKSFAEVADQVGLSRATVSSYATARPQTSSNKASRPKRENVIKLAQVLKQDVNQALLIAGHAPLTDKRADIPAPIIEAIGEHGEISERNTHLIANFILMLKKEKEENR